jgi:hypothetical protein
VPENLLLGKSVRQVIENGPLMIWEEKNVQKEAISITSNYRNAPVAIDHFIVLRSSQVTIFKFTAVVGFIQFYEPNW